MFTKMGQNPHAILDLFAQLCDTVKIIHEVEPYFYFFNTNDNDFRARKSSNKLTLVEYYLRGSKSKFSK